MKLKNKVSCWNEKKRDLAGICFTGREVLDSGAVVRPVILFFRRILDNGKGVFPMETFLQWKLFFRRILDNGKGVFPLVIQIEVSVGRCHLEASAQWQ